MKNSEQSDVIAVSTLAAYGSLAFPLAAAFIALQIIIPTFYAESSALSLTAIGALIFVARVCDIVSDFVCTLHRIVSLVFVQSRLRGGLGLSTLLDNRYLCRWNIRGGSR